MTFPLTTTVGRYRVCSLSTLLNDGHHQASVSIRSGQGSASTDRVMRFIGAFPSAADAHQHGLAQGLAWVAQTHQGVCGIDLSAPMPVSAS